MNYWSQLIAQHPLVYALVSPPLAVIVNDFTRLVSASSGWKEAWTNWKPGIATWHAFTSLINAVINVPIIAGVAAGASAVVGLLLLR